MRKQRIIDNTLNKGFNLQCGNSVPYSIWPDRESIRKVGRQSKAKDEFDVESGGSRRDAPTSFDQRQRTRFDEVVRKSELSLVGHNKEAELWEAEVNFLILGETKFEVGDLVEVKKSYLSVRSVAGVLNSNTRADKLIRIGRAFQDARLYLHRDEWIYEGILDFKRGVSVSIEKHVLKSKMFNYAVLQEQLDHLETGIRLNHLTRRGDGGFDLTPNKAKISKSICHEDEVEVNDGLLCEIIFEGDIYLSTNQRELKDWVSLLRFAAAFAKAFNGQVVDDWAGERVPFSKLLQQAAYLERVGGELVSPIENWNDYRWREASSYRHGSSKPSEEDVQAVCNLHLQLAFPEFSLWRRITDCIAGSMGFSHDVCEEMDVTNDISGSIQEFNLLFSGRKVSYSVIEKAIQSYGNFKDRGYLILQLVKLRSNETAGWVCRMGLTENIFDCCYGSVAMLYVDETRGAELCRWFVEDLKSGMFGGDVRLIVKTVGGLAEKMYRSFFV